MQAPRPRFGLRRLMVAVAVVGVLFALTVQLTRRFRMPSNSSQALAYVDTWLGVPVKDYDVSVRRLHPGELVGGQYGGVFEIRYIMRNEHGNEIGRRLVLIMEGGYCLQMAVDPEASK